MTNYQRRQRRIEEEKEARKKISRPYHSGESFHIDDPQRCVSGESC